MGLYELVERLEHAEALDKAAESSQRALKKVIPPGPVKDLLSGSWLGHPLHPALIPVPIGSWASAAVLDVIGGKGSRKAADRLIALGIVTALPTATTGVSDWVDLLGAERRIGFVHAVGNNVALTLMVASWVARKRGRRARGVLLSMLANGVTLVTAYLGGHLSYSQGVGVDTTVFDPGPQEWTPVADEAEVPESVPLEVTAAGATLVLVRRFGRLHALAARCTHRGGPLQKGEVADYCVVCPWHGSTFSLEDGSIERGPATQPQPVYETRVQGGRVEVRRSTARTLGANSA